MQLHQSFLHPPYFVAEGAVSTLLEGKLLFWYDGAPIFNEFTNLSALESSLGERAPQHFLIVSSSFCTLILGVIAELLSLCGKFVQKDSSGAVWQSLSFLISGHFSFPVLIVHSSGLLKMPSWVSQLSTRSQLSGRPRSSYCTHPAEINFFTIYYNSI